MKRATLAVLLSGTFLLSGCVSANYYHYKDEVSPIPNSKQFCNYQWPENIKVFERERRLFDTSDWRDISSWDDLFRVNDHNLKINIQQQCTGVHKTQESKLDVSVYYLTDINRAVRGGVTLPMFFASIATLFILPVYDKDYVYLCLDMKLQNGEHRYGLTQGDVVIIENLYGLGQDMKNGTSSYAAVRGHVRKMKLTDQLLIRAFDKAWRTDQSEFTHSSCKAALNAIVE